jgi:hypothetical protein
MMTRRQAAFRNTYREHISPWYNGWLHVGLVLAIAAATLWYALAHIRAPSWIEALVVPSTFILGNIAEWWIHRFIMHRPVKGLKAIYRLHSLTHHQFLDDPEPFFDSQRDFFISFYPPYALVGLLAIAAAPAALLGALWSANAAWLFMCTTVGLYLNYEVFHYCCHIRDDRIVRHVPLVNTVRRHHLAHHNLAVMADRNFNATLPIADWLFGTTDLERGLVGHLINGYDMSRVKRWSRSGRPLHRLQ